MAGKVIHVAEVKDHPDAVYIGRSVPRLGIEASSWSNPYKIGRDGTRAEVVEKFRAFLSDLVAYDYNTRGNLEKLRGKPLACWCRRSTEPITDETRCHGDVLLEIIEREFGS